MASRFHHFTTCDAAHTTVTGDDGTSETDDGGGIAVMNTAKEVPP